MTETRVWTLHSSRAPRLERWLGDLRQDLPYSVRQMRRQPGLASLIIATLAIGIGANATMAGAIDRMLNRAPPHIQDPNHVTRLLFAGSRPDGTPSIGSSTTYPDFVNLRSGVSAFEDVAAFTTWRLSLGVGADAEPIRASAVSASFFSLLGTKPALGRFFTPRDGFPAGPFSGGPPLAVLDFGFWRRRFASDARVLGRTILVGPVTYTIVGIAPEGFRGVDASPSDVWLPMNVAIGSGMSLGDRHRVGYSLVARSTPGIARTVVEEEATAVWHRYNEHWDAGIARRRVVAASVIRGRGPDAPREVKVALWLGGVSAIVLLIACANVTNLLLARAFTRRREIAVRLALGAGRGRLARQMLTEAGVLAALGGVAALYLARVGRRIMDELFVIDAASSGWVDTRLFLFTALVALGTAVLVSLVPVIQSGAPDLTVALRGGATTGGGRRSRTRSTLLAAQAALCMLLLVGAGLFAQSLRRVEGLDLGIDVNRTLIARLDIKRAGRPEPVLDAIYDAILQRVQAIPGVARAAFAEADPYRSGRAVAVHTDEHDFDFFVKGRGFVPMLSAVGSGYFQTVGASLRGRDFGAADRRGSPRVAIINQPVADLLWPRREALGRCIKLPRRSSDRNSECVTVVGVVAGYWYRSILERDQLLVYVPLTQETVWGRRAAALFIAVTGDPDAVGPTVRAAIVGLQPDLPAVTVTRASDAIAPQMRPWRLGATMFSIFGGVALLIATIGLYAVVSFTTEQRSSEIAVRIALGARLTNVLSAVAADGFAAVVAGLIAGAIAAIAARRFVGPLLFETSPSDPGLILGVAAALLGIAALAIAVPTARVLRRSPAAVLRVD